MTKLVPFSRFTKSKKSPLSGEVSVVMDGEIPAGFVFGRDSFITFLERIDEEFEENVKDQKKAFNNPAGKLIDLIEERLPLKEEFVEDLKKSVSKKSKTYSLDELAQALNVQS